MLQFCQSNGKYATYVGRKHWRHKGNREIFSVMWWLTCAPLWSRSCGRWLEEASRLSRRCKLTRWHTEPHQSDHHYCRKEKSHVSNVNEHFKQKCVQMRHNKKCHLSLHTVRITYDYLYSRQHRAMYVPQLGYDLLWGRTSVLCCSLVYEVDVRTPHLIGGNPQNLNVIIFVWVPW